MDINFGQLDLVVDGTKLNGVPDWFSNLTQFSYEVCSKRNMASASSEHFVISLPVIDGGLAAITLGSLAAEIERIEKNSNFQEITLNELEVGMRISIDSGIEGQQKITGQVKTISLDDKTPKIEIGSRWIAAEFIQRIFLIPTEAGNPQIFERKRRYGR
jgi:preprotein translocase subunit YajC